MADHRAEALSTQEKNPRSAVMRTVVVAVVAAFPILNITLGIIANELQPYGDAVPGWVFAILNAGIAITAIVIAIGTKIMAIPGVNVWLRKYVPWLAPEDKTNR